MKIVGWIGNRADSPAEIEITEDLAREFMGSMFYSPDLMLSPAIRNFIADSSGKNSRMGSLDHVERGCPLGSIRSGPEDREGRGGVMRVHLETAIVRAGDGDTFHFISLDGEFWYEVTRLPVSRKEVRESAEMISPEGQRKRGHMRIRAATDWLRQTAAHWRGAVEFGEVLG